VVLAIDGLRVVEVDPPETIASEDARKQHPVRPPGMRRFDLGSRLEREL
jgi:hypothetical protein